MDKITIIDYGVGNLSSIQNMLKKGGVQSEITGEAALVSKAGKLIFPGMGAFDNCMEKFNSSGLKDIIGEKVKLERVPTLGICVGLQMLMESSEEGVLPGLGWIKGKTIRFKRERLADNLKIPNMGWLEIQIKKESKLTRGLEMARFYFAHSFHVQIDNSEDELIAADYGYSFTAGIEKGNLLGVQFHPEKSHRYGLQLLKNFAEQY